MKVKRHRAGQTTIVLERKEVAHLTAILSVAEAELRYDLAEAQGRGEQVIRQLVSDAQEWLRLLKAVR